MSATALRAWPEVDSVDAFVARANARAILYRAGVLDLHEAVDVLQEEAATGLVTEIGQDAIQAIMAEAFGHYRG